MKNIWLQSVLITAFVFLMMWGVSVISDLKLFSAFDPVGQALSGFELTDYAFSNLRPDPTLDQRIIIVNFGYLSRREVAQQIQMISSFKPRVIGIDGFYDCEGGLRDSVNCPQLLDTLGNLMLASAIQEAGNVVLVSRLLQSDSLSRLTMQGENFDETALDVYDSGEYSDPIFTEHSTNAYANLESNADTQSDVKECRSFVPSVQVNGKPVYAFAVQVAMMYDSVITKKFLARNKYSEIVNYRGNVEINRYRLRAFQRVESSTTRYPIFFYAIDSDQIQNGEVLGELFKDNIVLMGFMGATFDDPTWEDRWFTPLNKKVAGRANPDMFGVVVHANIIAMILNQDYINVYPDWLLTTIAVVIIYLTVALFITIDKNLPVWFDALQVIIQVAQILLLSGLMVYVFQGYSLKLDLGITLAGAALVGPAYDIFKSIQNELIRRFTKQAPEALRE